jgi:hypothetical protein
MKRSIHIVVSLLAVILLARPFDCFASAKPSASAMDCCLKGKCGPTAKSDDCCKNSASDGGQAVLSKAGAQAAPMLALAVAPVSFATPSASADGWINSLRRPPPSRDLAARNLPLLI